MKIGDAAKIQAARNPENAIFDANSWLAAVRGPDVQTDIKLWPFKVESGQGDKPLIVATVEDQGKEFHPEEISAMILVKMKETAKA